MKNYFLTHKIKMTFSLCFIFCHFITSAQNWETFFSRSQNVRSLALSQPYLWIGTDEELQRKNIETGEVIRFTTDNSPIPSKEVNVLTFQSNRLWVGFNNGIGYYENELWTIFPSEVYSDFPEGVSSISVENDTTIWVSGFHSIARYDSHNWKIYRGADGVPYPDPANPFLHVPKIRHDGDKTWILTGELGMLKYQNGLFELFSIPEHPNTFIADFDIIPSGLIFVTLDGTFLVNENQVIAEYKKPNGESVPIANILVNENDKFCLYRTDTLWRLDATGAATFIVVPDNIDVQQISCMIEANADVIYFGTTKGLLQKNSNLFTLEDVIEGVPSIQSFYFKKILKDNTGNLWLASDQGLVKKNGNTWTVFNTNNSTLPCDNIQDLVLDALGNLWISSAKINYASDPPLKTGGVSRITPEGIWATWTSSNAALPTNLIHKLAFDMNGALWASLGDDPSSNDYMGLAQITISNANIASMALIESSTTGLPKSVPTDMLVDANNRLWLSFIGLLSFPGQEPIPGLAVYDGNDWTRYDYQNSDLPSILISAMTKDDANNLFFITNPYDFNLAGASLTKFDGTNWQSYPIPAGWGWGGFFGMDIQIDQTDKIWLATNKGVASYEPDVNNWTLYDHRNSPFPKVYINADYHNVASIFVDNNNTKYFGCYNTYVGKDGLVIYNETSLGSEKHIQEKSFKIYPNPVLTGEVFLETSYSDNYTIYLYDVLGRELKQINATNAKEKIDLSTIKDSFIFIKIKQNDQVYTQKLILNQD